MNDSFVSVLLIIDTHDVVRVVEKQYTAKGPIVDKGQKFFTIFKVILMAA